VKRALLGFALASALVLSSGPARAHDAYDDSQSHPLLLTSYVIYPVGFALEWLITRPIHFVASNPRLEPISGHRPHESPFGVYRPYRPEYEPD